MSEAVVYDTWTLAGRTAGSEKKTGAGGRRKGMDDRGKKIVRTLAFAGVLALVAGLSWAFLSLFHPPYADWLTVEAPARVAAGERVEIRVTLGRVPEPSVLVADIYLLARDHDPVGSDRALDPSPTVQSGGSYVFRFNVERKEKLALVQFVIYLSPNGRWRDRTRDASTVAIPVREPKPGAAAPALRKLRAYALGRTHRPGTPFRPSIRPEPEAPPRVPTESGLVLFVLLASGGLISVLCAYRPRPVRTTSGIPDAEVRPRPGDRRLWLVSAAVLFLLALSELLLLEGRLTAWGRSLANAMDIYYFRQPLQKAAMALMAAAVAGIFILAVWSIARDRSRILIILGGLLILLYAGLALAGALSFHYVDRFEALTLFGVSVVHAVKALIAAAVLALGLIALSQKRA